MSTSQMSTIERKPHYRVKNKDLTIGVFKRIIRILKRRNNDYCSQMGPSWLSITKAVRGSRNKPNFETEIRRPVGRKIGPRFASVLTVSTTVLKVIWRTTA